MAPLLSPSLDSPPAITASAVQLLCRCAQHPTNQANKNKNTEHISTLLQQDIDWNALILMSQAHGTTPLLFRYLTTDHAEAIPPNVLKSIKSQFHFNAIRNQYLVKQLLELLDFLSNHGIPAIPFKGPTLATIAYQNLALRQFSDLDILVRESDFLKARNLLLAEGYQRGKQFQSLGDIEKKDIALMKNWGEYSLIHPNGKVAIDLHGRLIAGEYPILSANFDGFWDRLVPVSLLDQSVETFCPEDLLLYLCVHGTKDLWKKIAWLCDIAAILQTHPNLDWSKIIERAERLECTQMLCLGLLLTHSILEVPLPTPIDKHILSRFKKHGYLVQLKTQMLSGIHPSHIQYSHLQRVRFHGQFIENRRDKWQYFFRFWSYWLVSRLSPNIHDQAFLPLPQRLQGLYVVIRPIRLLIKSVTRKSAIAQKFD